MADMIRTPFLRTRSHKQAVPVHGPLQATALHAPVLARPSRHAVLLASGLLCAAVGHAQPTPGVAQGVPSSGTPLSAAQGAPAPALPAVGSADDALRWFVEKEAAGQGRVEVKLGSLDARLQLAPCRRIEPYVPTGARLWGRTAIGVRCTDGASWNVSLPVTVTVWGRALVAGTALAAGSAPQAGDVRVQEIDLTREPIAPLTDWSQLGSRVLNRAVAPGQAIRPDMLRVALSVQAGDPVKVVLVGDGFSVNTDGQALSAGADGQPLRVRTEAGKVLSGTIRGRTVEIRL